MGVAAATCSSAGWEALGTFAQVVVTDRAALDLARELLERHLAALDLACSRFRKDSELAAVNASDGRPVTVSPLFTSVLACALSAAHHSDGDVDPTLGGPLCDVGYDRTFSAVATHGPALALAPRPAAANWRSTIVDTTASTVQLPPGVQLDLGATAKAWCADTAAGAIAQAAACGVLVNLGGDIAVAGVPPDGGWPVKVSDEASGAGAVDGPNRSHAEGTADGPTITIDSGGLATSSTRRRRWWRGEVALHHILDPATSLPAAPYWRLATVAAATCVDANTASTAAIVRGERAPAWLEALHLPARLVRSNGEVVSVGGWPTEAHQP